MRSSTGCSRKALTATSETDSRDRRIPMARQVRCGLQTLEQMGMHELLSPAVLDVLETYDFDVTRRLAVTIRTSTSGQSAGDEGSDAGRTDTGGRLTRFTPGTPVRVRSVRTAR